MLKRFLWAWLKMAACGVAAIAVGVTIAALAAMALTTFPLATVAFLLLVMTTSLAWMDVSRRNKE